VPWTKATTDREPSTSHRLKPRRANQTSQWFDTPPITHPFESIPHPNRPRFEHPAFVLWA